MKRWTGPEIMELREKYELTQVELALALNADGRQQTISEWETEKHSPGKAYSQLLSRLELDLKEGKWNSKEKSGTRSNGRGKRKSSIN